jgi:hypothetical protein
MVGASRTDALPVVSRDETKPGIVCHETAECRTLPPSAIILVVQFGLITVLARHGLILNIALTGQQGSLLTT